jgi:hypothetical protein
MHRTRAGRSFLVVPDKIVFPKTSVQGFNLWGNLFVGASTSKLAIKAGTSALSGSSFLSAILQIGISLT